MYGCPAQHVPPVVRLFMKDYDLQKGRVALPYSLTDFPGKYAAFIESYNDWVDFLTRVAKEIEDGEAPRTQAGNDRYRRQQSKR